MMRRPAPLVAGAGGQPWAALVVPATLDGPTLELLCEVLVRLDENYLRDHPEAPNLYDSGAWYQLRPEFWLTVPWALFSIQHGVGLDCKVLAAWRAAELRVRWGDRRARCIWSRHPSPGKVVYHVRVLKGDGRIEDPSADLGMHSVLPGPGNSLPEGLSWNLLPPH